MQLPAEGRASEGRCAKLKVWLYGFRPTPQLLKLRVESAGFMFRKGSSAALARESKDTVSVARRDQVTFFGLDVDLSWVEDLLTRSGRFLELCAKRTIGFRWRCLNTAVWTGHTKGPRNERQHDGCLRRGVRASPSARSLPTRANQSW